MRQSSPPIARFGPPLRGMDVREGGDPQSPDLLYNIDCSEAGVWKERPGFGWSQSVSGKVMGMHMLEVYDQALLVVISASATENKIHVFDIDRLPAGIPTLIFQTSLTDAVGAIATGAGEKNISSEPVTDKYYYSFAQIARRLYFCNGHGRLFELRWDTTDVLILTSDFLETGHRSDVMSYVMGNFSPGSLHSFYSQLVATGFDRALECPISSPIAEKVETIAELLVGVGRDTVFVDPGVIYLAHWALPRSFPIEDNGAVYWFPERDIISTESLLDKLLVFTKTGVDLIEGAPDGVRRAISERSLVSHRATAKFGDFLFFVAHDGCFVTNGSRVTKVSGQMDPLWFGKASPDITRYTQDLIKNTAYPFHVNRLSLCHAHCVNDRAREQIMVFLPSGGCGNRTNMCWVWNYSDYLAGGEGSVGKWAIWSGNEEPYYKAGNSEALKRYSTNTSSGDCSTAGGVWVANAWDGDSYDGFCYPPVDVLDNASTASFAWHASASAEYNYGPTSRVFIGTDAGYILELGTSEVDVHFSFGTNFKALIGLGKISPVDLDGRVVFTDVAVRKKQFFLNADDTGGVTVPVITVAAQSEGEAMNHILSTDVDMEFSENLSNMNEGTSRATKSALGTAASSETTMVLGSLPTGTSSPMLGPVFHDDYARLNLPDEDGRSVIIDLYSATAPHRIHISDIRIHGSIKGGATRHSGGPSSAGKVMTSG